MHLHFYQVSYSDPTRRWTITDFSNPEKIREQLLKHCQKGSKLRHFTDLAAFEEEALGYLMALSHRLTFTIDLSADTDPTLSRLQRQYNVLWTARPYNARNRVLPGVLQQNSRLAMLWAHQLRQLALFAQRPAYNQFVERWSSRESPATHQTRVPAFSLSGLSRWLPTRGILPPLQSPATAASPFVPGPVADAQTHGAWFLAADKTNHHVEETLRKTSSGRVDYRRTKIISRLAGVDAFAVLPTRQGMRGTISVTGTTTLQAILIDPAVLAKARTRLEERAAAGLEKREYVQAVSLYEEYLRTYPDAPRAEPMQQRLGKLRLDPAVRAAIEAEKARNRFTVCTKLAECALRNDQPEVARMWLTKIIRQYPETTWAAEAQQRLSEI